MLIGNYLVVALGVVDDGGPVLDVDLAHGVHPQRGVPPQLDVAQHAEVDGLEGAQLVEVGLLRIRSLEELIAMFSYWSRLCTEIKNKF